jgi:phosphohistidine phosphatase SixA
MNVYLYRHADALEGDCDADRSLSLKGRGQVARIAGFLKQRKSFNVDEVWYSPFLHAKETAQGFVQGIQLDIEMKECIDLEPNHSVENLISLILESDCNLMVVGHQPHLEQLALELLHGDPAWAMFNLKKGAVLALQYRRFLWQVKWMLTPGFLK